MKFPGLGSNHPVEGLVWEVNSCGGLSTHTQKHTHTHTLALTSTPLELLGGRGTRAQTERKKWPRAALPHQMSYAGAPDVPEAHAKGNQRSVSHPRALYLPDGGPQPNTFNCMRQERCTSSRPEPKLAPRSLPMTGSTEDDDS